MSPAAVISHESLKCCCSLDAPPKTSNPLAVEAMDAPPLAAIASELMREHFHSNGCSCVAASV